MKWDEIDNLEELFGDDSITSTMLHGKVEITLAAPDEKTLRQIAVQSVRETQDAQKEGDQFQVLGAGLAPFYNHGRQFVKDCPLTTDQFRAGLRKSSPQEKKVIYDFVTRTVKDWLDPLLEIDEKKG